MKYLLLSVAIIIDIFLYHGSDARNIEQSINTFSAEFFEVAAKKNADTNVVCSPISASIVLAMASQGAVGNTKQELNSLLHLPKCNRAITGIARTLNKLNSLDTVNLRLANKIYAANDLQIKSEFQRVLTFNFQSQLQNLDFSDSDNATQEINQWSAEATNNLIPELLQSGDISPDTVLFLVNSVYFKGNWKAPFNPENTVNKPFHVNAETVKEVPTMFLSGIINWGRIPNLGAEFVQLPYEDNDVWQDSVHMYVILPGKEDGVEALENAINSLDFDYLFFTASSNVELSLPKFKIESTIDVKEYLEELGAQNIFSEAADFSGITEDRQLSITKVVQKAFIEVNEEGTEGGVATGVGLEDRFGASPPNRVFTVNRPFYVIIASNDVILFTAKIVDPTL